MSLRIEDYALIGNCESAALVGRDGSIDWLGLPRFDSPACMAALLGTEDNGFWRIRPADGSSAKSRTYRKHTLILESTFETPEGSVVLIDCMGRRDGHADVVRLVRGLKGRVSMRMDLVIRNEYGVVIPWVSKLDDGRLSAVAGPERLVLEAPVEVHGENMRSVADFVVEEGEEVGFVLTWSPSFKEAPERVSAGEVLERATWAWREWFNPYTKLPRNEWSDIVGRSLITLKALTHHETGGIVAAPTTSLPEQLGGSRNWDYRFCWLRDATLTLYALVNAGFMQEAVSWRSWLLRAVAGSPGQMQIMYGIAGERRLQEYELPWLAGYEGSKPVRVGNAASDQLQLDVYGEVIGAMYQARRLGMSHDSAGWQLERKLVEHLETIWAEPDEGIWEVRGGRRHFVHSKVMAWVAFNCAVRSIEEFGLEGPLERWREVRATIHDQVCQKGFNPELDSFTQSYGEKPLDASLLLLPLVGFLPIDDPRIVGTVSAIERDLLKDGFVSRYDTGTSVDGLTGHEGAFLPCSFWLVDVMTLMGRHDEAKAMFGRLTSLLNDVGLISEEYDVEAKRLVGNFPQAFTHLALVNSALSLARSNGPAQHRSENAEAA